MLKNGDMVASLDKRYQAYSAHSSGQDKPYPPLCGAYGSIAMTDIVQLLGNDADTLLQHRCTTIAADQLYLPGEDYVTRVMMDNNRPPAVLRNMQTLYNTGRLAKRVICRFCRLTRVSNIPPGPRLLPTRSISIPKTR
jgi:hypothetical protein